VIWRSTSRVVRSCSRSRLVSSMIESSSARRTHRRSGPYVAPR
jgi:hypothetical protein